MKKRALWIVLAMLLCSSSISTALPQWVYQQCCRLTGNWVCCENSGPGSGGGYWPE